MYTLAMRKTPFVEGEFYHIYNRGVDKRVVFTEPYEYERFLAYLYMLNGSKDLHPADFFKTHTLQEAYGQDRGNPLVAIGAYCLMPNHFHLYMTPLVEGGISKFMQRLQTAYTKYFNEKYVRTGALFGRTFKDQPVDNDTQAKYLFSSIHLNPAKLDDVHRKQRGPQDLKKLKDFIATYPYSSYKEYSSTLAVITNPKPFPRYFENAKNLDAHIDDWLQLKDLTH